MGIPGVYFAAVSDGAEFREFQLLYAVRWGETANLQGEFRRAVEQYKPTWFALPPAVQPDLEYCYLPDRFRRVSTVNDPSIVRVQCVRSEQRSVYPLDDDLSWSFA